MTELDFYDEVVSPGELISGAIDLLILLIDHNFVSDELPLPSGDPAIEQAICELAVLLVEKGAR